MRELPAISSENILEAIGDLSEFLDNLPEYEREELEEKAIKALKGELEIDDKARAELREEAKREVRGEVEHEFREEVEGDIELELSPRFDRYLAEVARRVFGFSLAELSPEERMQIENIRKGLGIEGKFNPDA